MTSTNTDDDADDDAQQASLSNRPKVLDKADAGKSLSPRTGDTEQRDPARLAADDDPECSGPSTLFEFSQEPARQRGDSCDAAEGGMIELAAAIPPAGPSAGAAVPAAAADERQAAEVKEIRMDSGVALFRAFELATAPLQEADPPHSSRIETSPSSPAPDPAPPATRADSAATDEAASAEQQTSASRPARGVRVAQAIGVALGTLAIHRVRRVDKRRERSRV